MKAGRHQKQNEKSQGQYHTVTPFARVVTDVIERPPGAEDMG
jgi:hypothetical protein